MGPPQESENIFIDCDTVLMGLPARWPKRLAKAESALPALLSKDGGDCGV